MYAKSKLRLPRPFC